MQDATTKETLKFKFNRLLSRQTGDGSLMVELPAIRPNEDVLPVHNYRVSVETGTEPGADTDANVYVMLFGERGDTGRRRLVHSNNRSKFRDGQTDVFAVEAVSLGELRSCVVGHDGKGGGEGWKCEKVVVKESDSADEEFNFPCNK